uniref:CMP-N-acetylneuraminate-beta-galactosamide- alpha-2,3-sialyltransferase 2-like n=1 Tax=Oncorhynchus gorbuscha TaxID=8017 RepID=UPI001EAF5CE9|nr:CMP-N-acetylneuraminate-beta-galactosamide-alpha-2,3-sialyltransferase 2-like [Oncorhynchus gorbuscha]XP_046176102.1 CMP-N-acetylneuraminate-beta-galactosamide-alpha-2,3-sialyltransferase 2-like [Oncorhynchus gorbuscha]XP_046176103.1 CMP-N-acetylneuraminate-beta-galactosamide-alpha-2,3-sialyltransferase 2-like [Oncorhynchus gorbuscha]
MLFKRKLCLFSLFGGILFVMITIQKNNILSMTLMETHATSRSVPGPVVNRTWATPSAMVLSPDRICECPSCIADMKVSAWFAQHYDPQQQPFLTDRDNNMDPLALKWWLALQRSTDERTIYEVIQKMFQVIAPPPRDVQPKQAQCRKCAVVGNSGNLLGSQYGSLIDSHNSVIRMNKATTLGFEVDVGNRTTHHFMYPESAVDIGPGVHLVLLPFKLRDLQWVASALSTGEIKTTYMRVKDQVQADKDKVMVINPAFFKYTYDRWTERHGRYPSTGMLAIIFALHICDEVSVFGYGADQHGNWHHYWEENKYGGAFRKTGVHHADFEKEVIQKLDTEGKIKLHRR